MKNQVNEKQYFLILRQGFRKNHFCTCTDLDENFCVVVKTYGSIKDFRLLRVLRNNLRKLSKSDKSIGP